MSDSTRASQQLQSDSKQSTANPSGLCLCGCGQKTKIAPFTAKQLGWIKGQPLRYIYGHRWAAKTIEEVWRRHFAERGTTDCWEWQSTRLPNGYGTLTFKGKSYYAHRVAWEITNGAIADGVFVCHHCDNRACCNPAHLFLGTPAENSADMAVKGRADRPNGESNPHSRLRDDDVRAIRNLAAAGLSNREIARQYQLSDSHVWGIVKRKCWGHVE